MSATPNLGLPLMATNDAQKEVLYNEAIIIFDVMAARIVKDLKTAPPTTPADGDTYIVAATGTTGEFVGHENQIAFWFNGWQYITPVSKMKLYVSVKSGFYTFSGTAWQADATSAVNVLDDLVDVVITTPADADFLQYEALTGKWKNKALTATTTLAGMTDVALSSPTIGQFLTFDDVTSKWKNTTLSIPANTDRLEDLTDVNWTGIANNKILAWDATHGYAKWVDPVNPVPTTLAALTDVNIANAQANDALVFNGSAWGPSHLTYNYSFAGMSDGPGTMDGHAGQFMVVDSTESVLTFKSISDLLASSQLAVQSLGDVDQVEGGLNDNYVGRVLQLYKASTGYKFKYVTMPTVPSYAVKAAGTQVVAAMTSLDFSGFDVTHTGGDVVVKSIPLVWQAEGVDVTGPAVKKINFSGTGVGVTDVDGVLEVEVTAGSETISGMTDVDLSIAPSNGQALVWDGTENKWKPGAAGSGGGATKYDIGVFFPGGQVVANQEILRYVAARSGFQLSDDFANSKGACGANPNATTVFAVKRNGTAIGSISVDTSGAFTFTTTGSGAENFNGGDVLEVVGAATPDLALADISITFAGVPN